MGTDPPVVGRHGERLKRLRRHVRQRPPGVVIVDGRRVVEDLVRWRIPLRELYLAESMVGACAALAAAADQVWQVAEPVLAELAPTRHPQGVLAVVDEPGWSPWPARAGVALYLDGVQDPGNLGAIVRSAAGLGAATVLLSADSADPYHPAAVRGSAGAVFRLPVQRGARLEEVAARVSAAGGEVWATGGAGVPVARWRPREPVLLLLGAEGRGLSRSASRCATATVTVPLEAGLESLNVAVATAVLLHELRASRRS